MSGHTVTPNPAGYYDVLSGNSGAHYIVTVERTCTCKGYYYGGVLRMKCTHILAVERFAAEVLASVQGSGPDSASLASCGTCDDAPGRCPELAVELL